MSLLRDLACLSGDDLNVERQTHLALARRVAAQWGERRAWLQLPGPRS